jgi:HEPN domain-containing protein
VGFLATRDLVKPELLMKDEYAQLIEKGREIPREVVYARYPLKVAGKWVTPMEYYTREKTTDIIDNAQLVVDIIKTHLKRTAEKK